MIKVIKHFFFLISRYLNYFLLFLVITIFVVLANVNQNNKETLKDNDGILDLTSWNFNENPIHRFNGSFDFYWNQFPFDNNGIFNLNQLHDSTKFSLPARKTWATLGLPKKGFGTLVLHIKLPKSKASFGLKTFRIKSSCEIWLNGSKIKSIGNIGKTMDKATPSGKPVLIELPQEEDMHLVMPISNYDHSLGGGITTQIKIGSYNRLKSFKIFNLIEFSIAMTIAVLMGLYLLVMYGLYGASKDLYLGLFCVFVLMRILLINEVPAYIFWDSMPYSVLQKGRYIAGTMMHPFVVLCFNQLLPRYGKKWFSNGLMLLCLGHVLFVLLSSTYMSTTTGFMSIVFGLLLVTYIVYLALRLLSSTNSLHKWIFATILLLMVFILNDLLHLKGIINTMDIGKYSVLLSFFLGSQLIINMKFREEIELENQLMKSKVSQKDMLIKEVHHRAKNNYEIIAGLLEMQADKIDDRAAQKLVSDGRNRMKSMQVLHSKLYQTNKGVLCLREYVETLVREITLSFDSDNHIAINIECDDIYLDADTTTPLGLILNELVTNAYKHSFTERGNNELKIQIKDLKHGNYRLIVADNGKGLAENIDLNTSFGLRLIKQLTKQLHGTLSQTNENGARFEILFKDTAARKQVL